MKKILFSLILSMAISGLTAQQPRPCDKTIPLPKFKQRLEQIKAAPNEAQRMKKAMDLIAEHCLNSLMVKDVTFALRNDARRLEFAEAAFESTADPDNYYEVYNAFANISSVFRLHDYVSTIRNTVSMPPVPQPHQPPLIPPCRTSEQEFNTILNSIEGQSFNNTKLSVAKQAIESHKCFLTAQIKEIMRKFTFEENKLEIAKFAYDFCIDKQNYFSVNDVFTYSSSVDELTKYIQGKH